jgi:hypothetical protein
MNCVADRNVDPLAAIEEFLSDDVPGITFHFWARERNGDCLAVMFTQETDAAVRLLMQTSFLGEDVPDGRMQMPQPPHAVPSAAALAQTVAELATCVQNLRQDRNVQFVLCWFVEGETKLRWDYSNQSLIEEATSAIADAIARQIYSFGEP